MKVDILYYEGMPKDDGTYNGRIIHFREAGKPWPEHATINRRKLMTVEVDDHQLARLTEGRMMVRFGELVEMDQRWWHTELRTREMQNHCPHCIQARRRFLESLDGEAYPET